MSVNDDIVNLNKKVSLVEEKLSQLTTQNNQLAETLVSSIKDLYFITKYRENSNLNINTNDKDDCCKNDDDAFESKSKCNLIALLKSSESTNCNSNLISPNNNNAFKHITKELSMNQNKNHDNANNNKYKNNKYNSKNKMMSKSMEKPRKTPSFNKSSDYYADNNNDTIYNINNKSNNTYPGFYTKLNQESLSVLISLMEITETNDIGELLSKVIEINENSHQMIKYMDLIKKLSKLFYSLSDLTLNENENDNSNEYKNESKFAILDSKIIWKWVTGIISKIREIHEDKEIFKEQLKEKKKELEKNEKCKDFCEELSREFNISNLSELKEEISSLVAFKKANEVNSNSNVNSNSKLVNNSLNNIEKTNVNNNNANDRVFVEDNSNLISDRNKVITNEKVNEVKNTENINNKNSSIQISENTNSDLENHQEIKNSPNKLNKTASNADKIEEQAQKNDGNNNFNSDN